MAPRTSKRVSKKKAPAQETPASETPLPDPTPVMDSAAIEAMIAQRVADALANYESNRNVGSGHGGDSSQSDSRGNSRVCSYKDFQNCKPKSFFGDGGVIELTRWIEKMESVFQISFCAEDCKVKFAACTFMDAALSWWNGHVKTMGIVAANAMTWEDLKALMVDEYCPSSEIQNLEQELWNLTMRGSEITAYTNRFNDLATLCPGIVTPNTRKLNDTSGDWPRRFKGR